MNGATVTGMQLASQQQCVCVVLSDLSMTHEDSVKDPPPLGHEATAEHVDTSNLGESYIRGLGNYRGRGCLSEEDEV